MTLAEIENEIVDEFSMFDEWMEKYEYLIELGKDLPLISESNKVEDNLIRGCQSRVWLHAELIDGKVVFTADSDAIITKGIISLLVRAFSGQTPEVILKSEVNFIKEIGLTDHLSPSRSNGLVSMVKQMKNYSLVYLKST
ncbi:MAG: cysteine desulfuration protein SufE [Parvicellaceae bacterium]|jgi:cysteine desulfuration protein SufE